MHTGLRLVLFLASVGLAWAPAWAVQGARGGPADGAATLAAPAPGHTDTPAIIDGAGATAPLAACAVVGLPKAHALPLDARGGRSLARATRAVPTPRHRELTHDARGPPLA